MPSVINTNIASLNAQRNLSASQTSLATSLQRLSSGLRINSAKDDAAGLAISDRFSTQIRGLNQAIRNANDGISMAQTGEGALAEVSNNLQRIRELAVQATNSSNSEDDRAAINLEVQQRLAEIDRTAAQTAFNGTKLLDGSLSSATFQVGANVGETISIGLNTSVRLSAAGKIASATSVVLGATATGGSIAVTNSTLNFGTAASAATSGKATVDVATALFGTAPVAFVGGNSGAKTVARTDFSVAGTALTAGHVDFTATDNNFQALVAGKSTGQVVTSFDNDGTSAAIDGKNVQGSGAAITRFDYSGANLAQFDVTIGANTVAVTLNADYTNMAGVAAAIQAQVQLGAGDLATTTVANNAGVLTFTNVGSVAAVALENVDANAVTAGFAASTGVAGAAANAAAAFDVDTVTITMSTDSGTLAGFAADLTTKLQASALGGTYSAAVVDGAVVITHAGSTTAVAIANSNAKALASGITDSAGVAGVADAGSSTLDIDGVTVELNQNYLTYDNMAAAIETQLGASYSVSNTAGAFTISRVATGAASTAIDITGDAASTAAGITAGGGNTRAGVAGTDLVATTNASFTVGATNVTLNTDLTNRAGVLLELQSQLAGYNVTDNGTAYTFTSLNSSDAVAITNASAGAITAGFTNSAGTAGTAAVTTTNASLTIDGYAITLDADYADLDALATALDTKLETANAGADGQYTVANDNGSLTIQRTATGVASTAITFVVNSAPVNAFANIATVAGQDEVVSTNASFKVDGTAVTLNQNYANQAALVAALDSQLAGYTVSTTGGSNITITNDTTGSAAVALTANTDATAAAQAKAISSGLGAATGTAGVAGGSVTLANFSINGTSLAGSYTSSSALATAINSSVSNVYAAIEGGALKLTSSSDLELGGAEATGALGYSASTIAADSGSLSTATTLTVEAANTTIQRVDNALNAVSTLRSTFGAIQNRFDSVISSLAATSENLTAARSRIQDADFAAETATLTRNQILQQAGVAMLAQANALPQSVLALLK